VTVRRATHLLLVLALALVAAGTRANAAPLRVEAVDGVRITVSDLERSVDFYTRVLTFEKVGEPVELIGDDVEHLTGLFPVRVRVARLALGREKIELAEYLAPAGRPAPADARSNDRSFQHIAIVVSDMDKAYARLREHKVRHASSGPQRLPDWNPNAGGISAFYFRDPDGHPLEVISYPAGKGDPRWQEKRRLFLGIDHTAIVVSDTEKSLAFWRDTLGLTVAGTSENHGVEQERLNAVFGARLRITGLKAPAGPGIEFLEYLAPRDGRPSPVDERASDLAHVETRLSVAHAADAENTLRGARATFVSPGAVPFEGSRRALVVRDPDGHALLVHD